MGLPQLDFEGRTRVEVAIERLRTFEPAEGYYLAFSGGKDSVVIYDLSLKSGVRFDAHYQVTGIDPPELVKFIREHYPDVEWHRPRKSMFRLVEDRGLPIRQGRWCCQELKEYGGIGRTLITGVRWAESARRKQRKMFEVCKRNDAKFYLHPIIDWSNAEVWQYIKQENIPYCSLYDEGFTRLGCVLCPLSSSDKAQMAMQRWPKIAEDWKRAAIRYWEKGSEGARKFPSGEAFFEWWLSRESSKTDDAQCVMFE